MDKYFAFYLEDSPFSKFWIFSVAATEEVVGSPPGTYR